MNKIENLPEPEFLESEQPTGPRYSLANENYLIEDFYYSHPSGKMRMIRYPNPPKSRLQIRGELISNDLILGKAHNPTENNEQLFIIPKSARPIEYEASSKSEGEFSYNDDELLYELGTLLSELNNLNSGSYFFGGDIGKSVALVEFTAPGERKLQFTPGVEMMIEKLVPGLDEFDFYFQKISNLSNFSTANLTPFKDGYKEIKSKY